MVCTLIDRRDDVKTQVEPLSCGSWFHFKVLNILTSIGVWIMGNKNIVFDLFFTITLPVFDVHFRWKFSITKITLARREIAPRPLGVIYSSGPSARDKSIFPSLTLRLQEFQSGECTGMRVSTRETRRAWLFACLARFAWMTKKKERLLVVHSR